MLIEQPPTFVRLLWPGIWRLPQAEKTIYLTFDDGPHPDITPKVLSILDKYNIKATFFCVGDNARRYPEVLELVRSKGHMVGNHTMHHLRGFEYNTDYYMRDVEHAQRYLKSTLFRPPHGRITVKQMKAIKKNYHVVMWDVITRDYNPKLSHEKIFSIVKRYARNGSIVVFHDSAKAEKNILNALEPSILWLLEQGYCFKLISDVI